MYITTYFSTYAYAQRLSRWPLSGASLVAPVALVAPVPAPVPVPVHPQAAPVHRKRARAVDVTSAEFLQGPRPTGDKDDAEYQRQLVSWEEYQTAFPPVKIGSAAPATIHPRNIIYNMDDNTVRLGQRYDAQGRGRPGQVQLAS